MKTRYICTIVALLTLLAACSQALGVTPSTPPTNTPAPDPAHTGWLLDDDRHQRGSAARGARFQARILVRQRRHLRLAVQGRWNISDRPDCTPRMSNTGADAHRVHLVQCG